MFLLCCTFSTFFQLIVGWKNGGGVARQRAHLTILLMSCALEKKSTLLLLVLVALSVVLYSECSAESHMVLGACSQLKVLIV